MRELRRNQQTIYYSPLLRISGELSVDVVQGYLFERRDNNNLFFSLDGDELVANSVDNGASVAIENGTVTADIADKTTDGWGNSSDAYGDIMSMRIAVSSEKGVAANEAFGKELDYDLTMITHDMNCPLDEYSRVWIDRTTDQPHDYEVKRVARSLNCIAYALKRVTVS